MTPEQIASFKVAGMCWKPSPTNDAVCILEEGHTGSCGFESKTESMQGNKRGAYTLPLEQLQNLARVGSRGAGSLSSRMAREILTERAAQRCRLREFHGLLQGLDFCGPSLDRRCLACVYLEDMERDG